MNPDVTIYCLTYNHAEYIRDALEGFLNQKTKYSFNVFIYDDASTDGTSDILREYQNRYPDIFNIYISETNLHNSEMRPVVMNMLFQKYIQGKYVAWCEGDDYWIDSNKLQLQIDYMESHSECCMTAHGSIWIDYQAHEERNFMPFDEERDLTDEEIILQPTGNLSTASLVMRREIFLRDDKYPKCDVGDRPLQLYALCHGKIHFFNRIMSVYRYMHNGSWSLRTKSSFKHIMTHNFNMIKFFDEYNQYTCMRYEDNIRKITMCYLYNGIFANLDMNEKQYRLECEEIALNVDKKYRRLMERQYVVFEWIKGCHILNEEEREIIQAVKHIVIMGTGAFSVYVEQILSNNQIDIDGYVVTSIDSRIEKGKEIWELKNYPYEKDNTLVVVGIHQQSEESVLYSLNDNGFFRYIAPLWVY